MEQQTEIQESIAALQGFRVGVANAGLKRDAAALDVALIVSEVPCAAAGMFTTNRVQAAPVLVDQAALAAGADAIRAVVVNAGCANACTGAHGLANAHATQAHIAAHLGAQPAQVLVMSTGVIGTQLPMDKLLRGIDTAGGALNNDWDTAARAIMTTDTRPKLAAVQVQTEHGTYQIVGIAKGAGMIAPNMATMLGVIATDAQLDAPTAQALLRAVSARTFNCVVVDGDMSTNDTVLLLANGASGVPAGVEFAEALEGVCADLAQAIVRDGEGVTKFITLVVLGATDAAAARQIGNTIATSPLVKTAFYGGDPNWGRIIAAAGRAGVPFDPDQAILTLADAEGMTSLRLFADGQPTDYDEAAAKALMQHAELIITLHCGDGDGTATLWTCDLSHDYVSINGHYRS
jgi:glutamate N-acetyltransferase / amino-acid N-acetyltransferase